MWNWSAEPEALLRFFQSETAALKDYDATLSESEIAWFVDHSGIRHFYCASDESCSDMALKVARRALARRAGGGKGISGLICFHSTLNEEPDSSVSGRLQHELGLKGVSPFAIGQKSGNASLMALKVACHLMMSEEEQGSFLLVGADKVIPPYLRLFAKTTLISDSACAMVLNRESERRRILCLNMIDSSSEWFYGNPNGPPKTKEAGIYKYFSEKAALLIEQVFSELNLGWRDVALLLAPNFNLSAARDLSVRAEISWEKVWAGNMLGGVYLMSSDLVSNLTTALEGGAVKDGDIILALNLGLDFSIGCLALQV
jgi:3-oxoacyl-[acyl-carrier-protein] synthase III